MNFIKHNIGTIIAIVVLIVVVILMYEVKVTFFPDDAKAIYGDRLDGIKEYKITDEQIESAKKSVKDNVESIDIRVQGKIVEINVVVYNDSTIDSSKELANTIVNTFSDSQKGFYDFQIFINKETESDNFPIIGYRHHTSDHFTWTKDR